MRRILLNSWAVLEEKEKKKFLLLMIPDILISILDILSLALLILIVRFYIQPDSSSRLNFLPSWLANRHSLAFIGIFFILFGLKNAAAFFISRSYYRFAGSIAIRISRKNLNNYQESAFSDFINIDSSIHIRRIAFQPFEFCQYILAGMQQIITQLCLIAIALTAIILFNFKLFLLLSGLLLPPVIAIFYFMKTRMDRVKKNIRDNNEQSFQGLLDALKAYVEGNIFDRNDFFMRRFIKPRQQFSNFLFESISIQNIPPRLIEVFAVLGLLVLITIAKWSGAEDSQALVTIGAFMAAAYKIIPGIVKIINAMGQIKAYAYAADNLVTGREDVNYKNVVPPVPAMESLALKNISFSYTGELLLDDFNLTINKGDFAGITGISGKGKTTVFNLILGFLSPQKGEISINGHPVETKRLKDFWSQVSYTRQQAFFIHDTLLRNITLEEEGYHQENLQRALYISGLDDFISSLPAGLNMIITENGKNISGGQQQRIAIARAIYKNAGLLLLDEPFNELDEGSVKVMLDRLKELTMEGRMVIMITHDRKTFAWCNKIISLDEKG